MGRGERTAIAVGGVANLHGRCGAWRATGRRWRRAQRAGGCCEGRHGEWDGHRCLAKVPRAAVALRRSVPSCVSPEGLEAAPAKRRRSSRRGSMVHIHRRPLLVTGVPVGVTSPFRRSATGRCSYRDTDGDEAGAEVNPQPQPVRPSSLPFHGATRRERFRVEAVALPRLRGSRVRRLGLCRRGRDSRATTQSWRSLGLLRRTHLLSHAKPRPQLPSPPAGPSVLRPSPALVCVCAAAAIAVGNTDAAWETVKLALR
jgi:hypothetical protein